MINITLATESGISCGGWAIFAQICVRNTSDCCEEQIIEDPASGFSGGDVIAAQLEHCSSFVNLNMRKPLSVKLDSWQESEVTF